MKKELFIKLTVASLCLFFSAAFADQYDGSIIYVDAVNGNDSWGGWAPVNDPQYQDFGPKKTILRAVHGARDNVTVLVADGIYLGEDNINFAHILEEKSLTLRSANGPENCIIDCGGQNFPFQFIRPHNPQKPVAVIDGFTIINSRQAAVRFGNFSAAIITNCILTGNRVDPDFGVITCRNNTTASIIKCTFENNTANSSSAAISCINSAPIITGCSIVAPATWDTQSAFAINSINALPIITGCTITRSSGIGIQLISDDGVTPEYAAPVKISDCTLSNNMETAILLQADAEISNCVISENSAQLGAGIFVGDPSNPYHTYEDHDIDVTISGCTISNNIADSGPAIYCLDSNVEINDCLITENYAISQDHLVSSHNGASAIVGYFGNFHITNSVISENYGEHNSGYAISLSNGATVRIENSAINDNFAFHQNGGGLLFSQDWGNNSPGSSLTVENCEFLGNTGSWGEVNGISAHGNPIRIANCLILNEPPEQDPSNAINIGGNSLDGQESCDIVNCTILSKGNSGGSCVHAQRHGMINIINSILWFDNRDSAQVIYGNRNLIKVSHCIVHDPYYSDALDNGNINEPPLFADSVRKDPPSRRIKFGKDFHLKSQAGRYDPATDSWVQDDVTSPGIDEGDPAVHVGAEPLSSGGRINIGAYGGTQYASKTATCTGPIVGDLDNDCTVNLTDFAKMAANWMGTTIELP